MSTYNLRYIANPVSISKQALQKGIADAFRYLNLYYTTDWKQDLRKADLEIHVRAKHPQHPEWLNRTAWFDGRINIGYKIGGDFDSIRRTMLHEMMHYYGYDGVRDYNYHLQQAKYSGNRIVDIGGKDADYTEFDEILLHRKGVKRRSTELDPRKDGPWWRLTWSNWKNPLDVDESGTVTARDALLVINALRRGEKFDVYKKPKFKYDANKDGRVSAADSLVVLNSLKKK